MRYPLTLFLAALLTLLAFVLVAELHNADGEENCQDPEADRDPDGRGVHPAGCERGTAVSALHFRYYNPPTTLGITGSIMQGTLSAIDLIFTI